MNNPKEPKMKKLTIMIIGILAITITSLTINLLPEEEISLTHCGPGQYFDTDNKTCLVKSSIIPETIIEKEIVEKIITETVPMKVIRGTSDTQNIFIVDNGENPTVFLQNCKGLTVLNNPVMTVESDDSFTLRDSMAGISIFIDKKSTLQYQITTAPYSGESLNTFGTELMQSGVYNLKCEEEVVKKEVITDVFDYDVRLTDNDTILRIDGDVGKIVDGKRSITGMILLYENGKLQEHMESFNINLSSDGEFFESIDVDGISDSGKTWKDNKTYRVLISYDGKQITKDFSK